jgi:hypothetical protein
MKIPEQNEAHYLRPLLALFAFLLLATLLHGQSPSTVNDPDLARPAQSQESMDILSAICGKDAQSKPGKKGPIYGCRVCPKFTSEAGQGTNDSFPALQIYHVLPGSFTRPGAVETVVEVNGCEAHVNNFGGTVLLEKVGPRWKFKRYVPGEIGLNRAYKLKQGRTLALYQGGWTGQGETVVWLGTYDFASPVAHAWQKLITLHDSTANACSATTVTSSGIDSLKLEDLDHDGVLDLRVFVHWGNVKVPKAFQGNCDKDFTPGKVPVREIDFLFDGKQFHVAPASRKEFKLVSQE